MTPPMSKTSPEATTRPLRALEQASSPIERQHLEAVLREQTVQRIARLLIEYAAAAVLRPHDDPKSHDADAR